LLNTFQTLFFPLTCQLFTKAIHLQNVIIKFSRSFTLFNTMP
jgi:hypothetical protein